MKSLDEGGRPADAVRRYLIYQLAQAAPEIIGKAATVGSTGKFVDLCATVLVACGMPETGIAQAIPSVVRKLPRRSGEAAKRRTMIAGAFVPKPDEIFPQLSVSD